MMAPAQGGREKRRMRGVGIIPDRGGGEGGFKGRSRSYERAWARSSVMKGKSVREEVEEENEEEEGVDGWNKRVEREGGVEEEEEGFLKDVGMMGLLQQVLAGKGG